LLDRLAGCGVDGFGEFVFGVAAAGDEPGAKDEVGGVVEVVPGGFEFGPGFGAEDGDGDGVGEDEGRGVVELVAGSAEGYAASGAGWFGGVHGAVGVRSGR
jgi:hypothetical protein